MSAQILLLSALRLEKGRLARIVDRALQAQVYQSVGVDEQAELLVRAELYYGDWRSAGPNMLRIKGVTPREVADVVNRYMESASYACIGDPKLLDMVEAKQ
ncbi:MAG TPA: hypothetical protein VFU46_12660 [Gemmatimonadales bacterium]|nr:hypothetical protein [Gemmatimonadales bacterium]